MEYIKTSYKIQPDSAENREILVAKLGEIGYESFTETDDQVEGYMISADFSEEALLNLFPADFSEFKTMNFLSYEVFKYYKENGIKVVDIGPSTEDSIPNHGLCEFKESIGCDLSPKYSFYKKIE